MHMWRSEVTSLLSVLSSHLWVPGIKSRLLGMVASALLHRATSWDLACFELCRGGGFRLVIILLLKCRVTGMGHPRVSPLLPASISAAWSFGSKFKDVAVLFFLLDFSSASTTQGKSHPLGSTGQRQVNGGKKGCGKPS